MQGEGSPSVERGWHTSGGGVECYPISRSLLGFVFVHIQRLNAYFLLELSGSLCSGYGATTFVALHVDHLGGIVL